LKKRGRALRQNEPLVRKRKALGKSLKGEKGKKTTLKRHNKGWALLGKVLCRQDIKKRMNNLRKKKKTLWKEIFIEGKKRKGE